MLFSRQAASGGLVNLKYAPYSLVVNIVGDPGDLLLKTFKKYSKNCILLKVLPNLFKTKRNEKVQYSRESQ